MTITYEYAFEQSAGEFVQLLKNSAAQFSQTFKFGPVKSLPSVPDVPPKTPTSNSGDYVVNNINASSRPSIDIETPSPGSDMQSRTVPSMIEPKLNSPSIKSEPVISTDHFPRKCNRKYTLVLDLDETLIHFKNDVSKPKFLIRPYAYNFLKNLSSLFEIIIFTAAQKEYADWILDKIDSRGSIVYRLYREHCQMSKTSHLKDIGMLKRDLSKTIIVDNFAENFALHKENGICIRSWYGDLNDQVLVTLERFLLGMAEADVDDVRKYMKIHIENNPEKGIFIVH